MSKAQDPVMGTCDGTGAKIYVSLGFQPSRVDLINIDSANFERVHWTAEMGLVAAYADEGRLMRTNGGADATTKLAVSSVTQQGIRQYAGGDVLKYSASSAAWVYGASDTAAAEVFVDGGYARKTADSAAYQCVGSAIEPNPAADGTEVTVPPGFSIGADSNINANGEQLQWTAWR